MPLSYVLLCSLVTEYGIYDMPVGLLPIAFETPTFLSPTKDVPQVVVEFESKRSFFPETWLFKTLQMKYVFNLKRLYCNLSLHVALCFQMLIFC